MKALFGAAAFAALGTANLTNRRAPYVSPRRPVPQWVQDELMAKAKAKRERKTARRLELAQRQGAGQ